MFSRLRAPGLWTLGSTVDPVEWETFDANQSNAIDGDGGGAYSPSDDIVIGGAPGVVFQIDCEFDVTGPAVFLGPASFQEEVSFFEDVSVLAPLFVGTGPTDYFVVNGDAFFHEDVTFSGNGTIEPGGTWLVDADTFQVGAGFGATFEINSGAFFNNEAFFDKPVNFTGTGKICHRSKTITVDANQSVVAANYDTVFIPDGTLSANRDITIDDTGARDGMRIKFKTREAGQSVTVRIPGGGYLGGSLATAALATAPGVHTWLEAERIGGVWELLSCGDDTP